MEKQNLRVLLIEDDKTNAVLTKALLAESQFFAFETVHCASLATSLERLRRERFDLGLLDLGLPDSFGLETLKRFSDAAPALPVIILSGNTDIGVSMEGVSLGAQDYLLKGSFDGPALTRAIHYAIERKKIERFKEDFSGVVSHELRAPLAVIKGAIDGLRDGALGPLNDKQNKFLALAAKHVQRLSKIIINILDLARYESGRAAIKLEPVDVALTIQESQLAFQTDAAAAKISLELALPANLPAALADGDMLAEVLNNLVSNALRFAKSKIEIRAAVLSAADAAKASGFPVADFAKENIFFSVTDDGPGISEEQAKDLFNKFVQFGRQAGAHAYKGTGLGLSICKTVLHLLNGRIWVVPGAGARFHFTLPAAPGGALARG